MTLTTDADLDLTLATDSDATDLGLVAFLAVITGLTVASFTGDRGALALARVGFSAVASSTSSSLSSIEISFQRGG